MEALYGEDGHNFIRSLAQFIRQHEKALANSLQLSVHRRSPSTNSSSTSLSSVTSGTTSNNVNTASNTLAAALSFTGLNFMSHNLRAAHLTLTPHHLFYLLSQIDELGISVGPMNVRLENLVTDLSPTNYVSFLQPRKSQSRGRSDRDSIHSVSSMRSVMSSMSALWSSIGLGSNSSKNGKAKAATEGDLKYLYSAFTKLPSLRLTSDHRAALIRGYEEFPFDTAVPLFVFKNVQQLDIVDLDFRHFYGWDRLAEQLCLLTVKRANLDDPADLLTNIVLDDAEKRRRRSTKGRKGSPIPTASWTVPTTPGTEYGRSQSDHGSLEDGSPGNDGFAGHLAKEKGMAGSVSPKRPSPSRPTSAYRHIRSYSSKINRSGSGSSNSSDFSLRPYRSESSSTLMTMNVLPQTMWQRLKYLSLADNSLTTISAKSLAPVATTLRSLNLSSNLFTEIPDSLALLTRLTSLDLSNCMIESLQSLSRSPLPAITTIKLKSNRLRSLAGVERLLSLENLNVQDNLLSDPMESARLTSIPNLRRIWLRHNPFTKSFSDYRVTAFNLFRQTSGYIDDLIIDGNGPSYFERRQLVDRVPEVERKMSQPTIRIAETPVIVQGSEMSQSHPVSPTEVVRNSTRRRKAPQRRIVDLAQYENHAQEPSTRAVDLTQNVGPIPVEGSAALEQAQSAPETDVIPSNSNESPSSILEGRKIDQSEPQTTQSDYRAKVEALRQEFGTNWLQALGDQNWHTDLHIEAERSHSLGHAPLLRSNSQAIVSGGRTLG